MLASYAGDYPHGKFYCVCLGDIDKGIDLKAQEAPLERADEGKAPFHRLDYPDNYFDVIMSGYSSSALSYLTIRCTQLILTIPEWPAFLSELYRILKPGYFQNPMSLISGDGWTSCAKKPHYTPEDLVHDHTTPNFFKTSKIGKCTPTQATLSLVFCEAWDSNKSRALKFYYPVSGAIWKKIKSAYEMRAREKNLL